MTESRGAEPHAGSEPVLGRSRALPFAHVTGQVSAQSPVPRRERRRCSRPRRSHGFRPRRTHPHRPVMSWPKSLMRNTCGFGGPRGYGTAAYATSARRPGWAVSASLPKLLAGNAAQPRVVDASKAMAGALRSATQTIAHRVVHRQVASDLFKEARVAGKGAVRQAPQDPQRDAAPQRPRRLDTGTDPCRGGCGRKAAPGHRVDADGHFPRRRRPGHRAVEPAHGGRGGTGPLPGGRCAGRHGGPRRSHRTDSRPRGPVASLTDFTRLG
ncbi:hypothetical protein TUE45_pSRTUE45c_0154 (plasmid) [Streptomyces reticuli]|nr:hypothetical protein TUE45_pSRTUE45c_0154 [Streptomyces reticuli]